MNGPFIVGALLLLVPFATLALYGAVSFEVIGGGAIGRNVWRTLLASSLLALLGAVFLFGQSTPTAISTAAPIGAAPSGDLGWTTWRADLSRRLQACKPKPSVDCLSASLNQAAAPHDEIAQGITGVLYDQLRRANQLMLVSEARDVLWKGFGIDDKTFMGTGYSLPAALFATMDYGHAAQREYFLPNLCADSVDAKVCATEDPNVWTWQISPAELRKWQARPLGDLLKDVSPKDHVEEFQRILARWGGMPGSTGAKVPGNAFIRFAHFKQQYYAGTLGRPDAKLVFAASLEQTWGMPLGDIMRNTGSADLDNGIPEDQVLFVWLYLAEPPAKVPPATWSAVFDALKATR